MCACLGIAAFHPVKRPMQAELRIHHTLIPVTPLFPVSLYMPKYFNHINKVLKKEKSAHMLKLQQQNS